MLKFYLGVSVALFEVRLWGLKTSGVLENPLDDFVPIEAGNTEMESPHARLSVGCFREPQDSRRRKSKARRKFWLWLDRI